MLYVCNYYIIKKQNLRMLVELSNLSCSTGTYKISNEDCSVFLVKNKLLLFVNLSSIFVMSGRIDIKYWAKRA